MLYVESKFDSSLLDTIDSVPCVGAFEQFLLFAIGSGSASNILEPLLHFYLRLFSSYHAFLRLLVDTEIRLGSHPSLLAHALSSSLSTPPIAYHLLRLLESTLSLESEFVKVAAIINRFLLQQNVQLAEDSFLPLLSIAFHTLETQSPVYWIAQSLIASFLCVWNRVMNRSVHPFIQSAFELLGFHDLHADSTMKLPYDGSFVAELFGLMERRKIDELRKICEVTQSLGVSFCLCYDDVSIVRAAATNLSNRLDPLRVVFPLIVYGHEMDGMNE